MLSQRTWYSFSSRPRKSASSRCDDVKQQLWVAGSRFYRETRLHLPLPYVYSQTRQLNFSRIIHRTIIIWVELLINILTSFIFISQLARLLPGFFPGWIRRVYFEFLAEGGGSDTQFCPFMWSKKENHQARGSADPPPCDSSASWGHRSAVAKSTWGFEHVTISWQRGHVAGTISWQRDMLLERLAKDG